jgi:hypothetical protein
MPAPCHLAAGVADGLQQAAPTQAAGSNDPVVLGSKSIPYVQPGCTVMFMPEQWCRTRPSPSVRGCCTPGYACVRDSSSVTGRSCQPAPQKQLQYSYDRQAKGGCSMFLDVGSQCGGTGFECFKLGTCDQFGPWARACCPNGYSCQPSGQDFRLWLCQVNVQDQPAGARAGGFCPAKAWQLSGGRPGGFSSQPCLHHQSSCSMHHAVAGQLGSQEMVVPRHALCW